MKKLKEYFTKTSYGNENAKEITKNIRDFVKDKYNVNVKTKKSSSNPRYGGKVTGVNQKTIKVEIESKEKFDLKDFIDNFYECEFCYDNSSSKDWGASIMPYRVILFLNNVELDLNKKWRSCFVDADMLSAEAFDGVSRGEYYFQNQKELNQIYFEKISKEFLINYNKHFKVSFIENVKKLTNGSYNIFDIILKRNSYINEKLTLEECEKLTSVAKYMRNDVNTTQQVVNYLLTLDKSLKVNTKENKIVQTKENYNSPGFN